MADVTGTHLFQKNYKIPEGCDLTINRGGTSSGKTYNIVLAFLFNSWDHPNSITTVVGQDLPNLKKGSLRDLETILATMPTCASFIQNHNRMDNIFVLKNGAIIEFNSYHDEQDAKNGKRDFLFVNEANGIPHDVFRALYDRTRFHTWIDFNPSAEFWVSEQGYEQRPSVRTIHSTYKHNPFLEESQVRKIEAYEPTDENIASGTADVYRWKVYGLGEYAALDGAVIKRWTEGEFDDQLEWIGGVDWGTTDPTVLIRVAVDEKKKKIYVDECVYKPMAGSIEIRKAFRHHVDNKRLLVCDSAQMMSINDLRRADDEGLSFNAIACFKRAGIVKDRIKWLNNYQIVVTKRSVNVKKS